MWQIIKPLSGSSWRNLIKAEFTYLDPTAPMYFPFFLFISWLHATP